MPIKKVQTGKPHGLQAPCGTVDMYSTQAQDVDKVQGKKEATARAPESGGGGWRWEKRCLLGERRKRSQTRNESHVDGFLVAYARTPCIHVSPVLFFLCFYEDLHC